MCTINSEHTQSIRKNANQTKNPCKQPILARINERNSCDVSDTRQALESFLPQTEDLVDTTQADKYTPP